MAIDECRTDVFSCPECKGDLFGTVVEDDFDYDANLEIFTYEKIEGECSACSYRGTFVIKG